MLKPRKPLVAGSQEARDSVIQINNRSWDKGSNLGKMYADKLSPADLKIFSDRDENVKKHGMKAKEVRIAKGSKYVPGVSAVQVDYDETPIAKAAVKKPVVKAVVVKKEEPKAKREVISMKTIPTKNLTAGKKTPELQKTKKIIGKPTDIRGLKVNKSTGVVKQRAVSKLAEKTTGQSTFRRAAEVKAYNLLQKKGIDKKFTAQKTNDLKSSEKARIEKAKKK
jgi:hypothetical protein